MKVSRWEGKRYLVDTYRFINGVPLKDRDDALEVNWCELITRIDEKDKDRNSSKVIYKNAFATNFEITEKNVKKIVADGRARWKVENENNNVLKTKGYHLEHNFGHGKENLAALFATFTILAFLFHTVLEWGIIKSCGRRKFENEVPYAKIKFKCGKFKNLTHRRHTAHERFYQKLH